MTAIAKMLDKVRETCSLPSDAALAARLGITRQTVHCWRNGVAYPNEDHVARLAAMAHADAGEWLLATKAESTTGPAAKAWAVLAKRLASAAALVLLVGAASVPYPAAAKSLVFKASEASLYIMSSVRKFLIGLRSIDRARCPTPA